MTEQAPPQLEFLMAISAEVGELVTMGPAPLGERRVVYITGGTFAGPRLRGEVMAGADWQIARRDGALELVDRRPLAAGDFYVLIPPHDDIHRVRTTSPETSVSIHLLTNDTGCVWRHAFDPESGAEQPFRSGYVNVTCD